MESSFAMTQSVPSGLWDAPRQVPWTYLCSGFSRGLESDLLLQWERLRIMESWNQDALGGKDL